MNGQVRWSRRAMRGAAWAVLSVSALAQQPAGQIPSFRASVELTTRSPSKGKGGRAAGSLPVASSTAGASRSACPPSAFFTATLPGPTSRPCP